MTAKEWLMRGWKIDREINALLQAKQSTWDRLTSVTASYAGDPVQAESDPHKYDCIIELDANIDRKIDQLVGIKTEIVDGIAQIDDARYRTLLTARYVSYKTWEQIAVELNYSWRQVHRLHGQALQEMERIIMA